MPKTALKLTQNFDVLPTLHHLTSPPDSKLIPTLLCTTISNQVNTQGAHTSMRQFSIMLKMRCQNMISFECETLMVLMSCLHSVKLRKLHVISSSMTICVMYLPPYIGTFLCKFMPHVQHKLGQKMHEVGGAEGLPTLRSSVKRKAKEKAQEKAQEKATTTSTTTATTTTSEKKQPSPTKPKVKANPKAKAKPKVRAKAKPKPKPCWWFWQSQHI